MQKVVLVTGASTGIGFDTVRALTENKFLIVATVRKQEDEVSLNKNFGDKVKVIRIDLSDLSELEKIPQILKQEFKITELYGLVNNAGVAMAGPFAFQDFSEVQSTFQLNVFAVMKLTQLLIPLMKADARIVNISSIAGKSASPFLAVYASSKHALEGFSVALRKELMLLGIKVVIVAPGSIKTPIWQKGLMMIKDHYAKSVFAGAFSRFVKIASLQEKNGLEVSEVSSMIVEAMTVKTPKFRYAPMPNKLVNWYLPRILPDCIYDRMTAKVLGLNPK